MSASSKCVTCGTFSQALCRCLADSLLIRLIGTISISPNFDQSGWVMTGIPMPASPPAAVAAADDFAGWLAAGA